jgi:hypothetical protein
MRRIVLVLSAAALVAAITAISSVSGFAQEQEGCETVAPSGEGAHGIWKVICEEEEVRSEEVSRTPSTDDCEIGKSGRQGIQEGELVLTDEVTYTIITTTRHQGHPSANPPIESTVENPNPTIEEVRGESTRVETFEPTGPCRPEASFRTS